MTPMTLAADLVQQLANKPNLRTPTSLHSAASSRECAISHNPLSYLSNEMNIPVRHALSCASSDPSTFIIILYSEYKQLVLI